MMALTNDSITHPETHLEDAIITQRVTDARKFDDPNLVLYVGLGDAPIGPSIRHPELGPVCHGDDHCVATPRGARRPNAVGLIAAATRSCWLRK